MLSDPSRKYRSFAPISLPDRQWPNRVIAAPPVWMSTDLRDGNQALFEPMNVDRKMRMFRTICAIGIKEIEVGFPSASQPDFDFVRTLIEDGLVPGEVTIEALTPAREPLIRRTVDALAGARRAIVHLYNATSRPFRDVVFGMSRAQVVDMAVSGVRLIRELTDARPGTEWLLEYSPETFSDTELEFALEVCDAVTAAWGATPQRKVILNLPGTVEVATPNVYADQIEWMHRSLARRDSVVLSLHPHNDRGTAVAAAELGLMAGADRVEGCLFGNGERTGNVDLVTLALNLYTQGISPGLDFSDINAIARTVEHCTQLPIHPRHPYVGDLVFTAFSGSHQDAIRKGFAARESARTAAKDPADGSAGIPARNPAGNPEARWEIPYLPIDPRDLGRSYDSVIRVNSQSGKGGVAYLMETEYGVVMPRRLQVEFSRVVQTHTETTGTEVSAGEIWALFDRTYLQQIDPPVRYLTHHLYENDERQGVRLRLQIGEAVHEITGEGNGPIDAAVQALAHAGWPMTVRSYEERSMAGEPAGSMARASAFVEVSDAGAAVECYGVGIDANIVSASIRALVSAAARLAQERAAPGGVAARISAAA